MQLRAPKGMRDILPPDGELWRKTENILAFVARLYGYKEIRTPILEYSVLFRKGLGGSEVEIHVEGPIDRLARFFTLFAEKLPPPAKIEEFEIEEVKPLNLKGFVIRKSSKRMSRRSMIPPDFAICRECLAEILDPKNTRRYRYPFNSC
ncbi:MAG TPA: hypothetical protein EYP08_08835, partial [Pyrodictiaceae archaeon]|nr:hypothetical protein [Pyrodictiaceae archaeon]